MSGLRYGLKCVLRREPGHRRRISAAALAAVMIGGLVVVLPASPAAAALADDAARPKERTVPVGGVARRDAGVPQSQTARWSPSDVSWPQAAAGVVDLPAPGKGGVAGLRRRVGSTPVSVGAASGGVAGVAQRPSRVRAEVLGRQAATAAGVNALLLRLSRADGAAGPGVVSVEVDVSAFSGAFGGDWGSRLRVVRFPGCVLTTPGVGECSTGMPEPSSVMDSQLMRLSADVVVGPPGGVTTDPRVARALAGEGVAAVDEPVFAVMALAGSSDTGDFSQTQMSPSSSWQAGDSGGEFSWSYDLRVPPTPGGLEPDLSLGYSSGAVDGQTAGKNVQPSWLGEGWDFQSGYIERAYRACVDDVATGKEVRLYPGNGTGSFIGGSTIPALRWTIDPGVVFSPGDLSGDGEVDVIYRDAQDMTLWMARGNGTGGWLSEPGLLDAGNFSGALMLSPGDFSGDGHPDVMYRLASGTLVMRRGTAAGGLEATSVSVGSFGGANMIFSPGDFNGDGKADVLWRRASDSALMAIWGNGNGGWVTGQSVVIGTGWGGMNLFTGGDFSGDGKADVIVRRASDNVLLLYRGSGTGGFSNGTSPNLIGSGWGSHESIMITPDFDNDGKADLLSSRVSGANPYYANATADLCWRQDNARLVFGGRSTDLVLGTDGKWRAGDDDGAKVELLTGAGNWDNNGEHWRLTTVDGTQFYFGLNRMPNWSAGKRETHSAWNVPVFANHQGEPCFSTTSFVASRCNQSWRWNLDYVVDATGNSMAYFYLKDQGKTGLAGNANSVIAYERGGQLDHIEYGMRAGTELTTATPPAKVVFGAAERCLSACWAGAPWTSAANAANWPDTPWDLHCATTATSCPNSISPTFFVTRRLASATTQLWTGSGATYTDVDKWDFTPDFPLTGNNTSEVLWLVSIRHTGKANGGNLALPTLSFGGTPYDQRADYDPNATMAQPRKYRITTVDTESGGQVAVAYSGTDSGCVFGSPFPNPEQNTKRCFAQWYKPQQAKAGFSWWHKYRVESVTEKDLVGGSPDILHSYAYSTAGSSTAVLWGHDDGPARWSTPLARRSWGDWRGYPTVTVTVGPAGGTQTQTKHLYFRGLQGDYLAQGQPTRVATITNSAGEVWQDHPALAGMLHETIELDGPGGSQLARAITDPVRHQTGQRIISDAWAIPVTQTSTITRTGRDRDYTWIAATSSWRLAETAYAWHSAYGVLTQANDLGDSATSADDVCTRLSYVPNTTKYLVDFPSRQETVGVRCETTPAYPADALGDARYFYDLASVHGTPPVTGNVTKVEQAGSFTGSTPNYVKAQTAAYDTYGRVTSSGDALDRFTTTNYTQAPNGLLTALTVTNPATHQAATTVDQAWGLPVTVTDANGKITTVAYDALGRLIKVWKPGRATNLTPNAEYGYTLSKTAPSWVSTKDLGPNGNQITSYEILDGLLRTRQSQAPTAQATGGRLVTDLRYDGRGLKSKLSTFHNVSSPASTLVGFADADVANQSRYIYDSLGRATTDQLWSLGVEKWRTTTAHEGDRRHVTPPAGGTATTTIVDAHDRVTQLRQYTAAGTPTGAYQATSYGYDRLDRLTTATDPAGNDWAWSHDLRGRLVGTTDPDKGATSNGYDNADQLVSTTDARNITLARAYDSLGRVTSLWQNAVGTGTKRAEWLYDTVADGQLTSATRYDAGNAYTTTITGYDDGYRPLGISTTFPVAEATLAGTYTTNYTYNVNGSPATQVLLAVGGLPAETITTGYDTSGFPISAVGLHTYVADTSYYSFGAPHQRILGAGTKRARLTSTLDEATRRTTGIGMHTENQTTPGTWDEVRTDSYSHNPAGAVSAIADTLAGAVVSNQCHLYDRLQRLTEAWTTTAATCQATPSTAVIGGPDPFWTSWTHNEVGNRTGQTRHGLGGTADTTTGYTYPLPGTPQPHTLLSATTTGPGGSTANSYGYDNTGNTTNRAIAGTGQTLGWDPEGHLASYTIGAQTTSYLYAADGSRLLRRDPNASATAYLGGYEIRKDPGGALSATRYYAVGGGVIASRDPSGLTWLGGDHHGTAQVSIDANTLNLTARRMMPYGEPRGTPPAWVNDKGFVGGTTDPTGLTHLGAREYDPTIGRFLSVDPIQDLTDPQQWHGYAYANNNPTTWTDPDGLVRMDPSKDGPCGLVCEAQAAIAKYGDDPNIAFKASGAAVVYMGKGALSAIKELSGFNDAVGCVKGNAAACGWFAAGVLPVTKLGKALKGLKWADEAATAKPTRAATAAKAVPSRTSSAATAGRSAAARRCLLSFSADTHVLLADGTSKPISDVKVGDKVLATDPETGETAPQEVTAVWIHDDTLVDLDLANGAVLTTTEDHPFWNATDHQWQQAQALDNGDQLLTATGGHVVVDRLDATSSHLGTAYNLSVANIHTYYVVAGTTPVLVHNCGNGNNGIGFAPGEGTSPLTPDRLQHGTRYLTEAGILPQWKGKTSPQLIHDTLAPILENPLATFNSDLGGTKVRGFIGQLADSQGKAQPVAIMVFSEGPNAGKLATSVVPSVNQMLNWFVE